MTRLILYLVIGSFFSSCAYTKNWQGTSNAQVAQAEFKELTGKQVFVMHVPNNDTYLAYRFKETDGELKASIRSTSAFIVNKTIDFSEENAVHLVNQKGAEYKVTLKGKHASGAFDVRFLKA
ncbi:hypothetical protein [Spirosoma radiotolerans]|uniref:Lipoprotein n=1 Tax=Spirosoma radiotolerans TaxID=1379870 RepID=A0A0E3ZW82_9BACT|nr:hypothetical protein [Spirosoma radiotolerans]AKD55550.1 hypothetical protein SD10_12225 [Spirosoma radiotolerans]